jgi:hypothetical protein
MSAGEALVVERSKDLDQSRQMRTPQPI